ncbi:MAG TPA: ABC transporter permease subunit [Mycobacteriales bacterium]|nr:ABC transporter permease subunit [Mycobacteriales bacterium]
MTGDRAKALSWHGVSTVARQEFVLRIRAGRWRWLLGVWFVLVTGFTVLVHVSVRASFGDADSKGVVVYGSLVLFVLALALLVVPSLTGQSVNGDRERGTLATLQVTRLSALEIALGKLGAAWGTAVSFLLLALPAVAYSMALGGVPLTRVVVVSAVMALLLGVVAALALCLSSLLARSTTSGVLSYLTVFALTIGTLVMFGIGAATSTENVTKQSTCPTREDLVQQDVPPDMIERLLGSCEVSTYETTQTRTDHVWWLLAPNPFVIVADAAPQLAKETAAERRARQALEEQGIHRQDLRSSDPLGAIGRGVRDLRKEPGAPASERKPVWPFGLAFDLLLAAGAVWLTSRRLHAPSRALPRGQRVA